MIKVVRNRNGNISKKFLDRRISRQWARPKERSGGKNDRWGNSFQEDVLLIVKYQFPAIRSKIKDSKIKDNPYHLKIDTKI
jgi:hypothetical protein